MNTRNDTLLDELHTHIARATEQMRLVNEIMEEVIANPPITGENLRFANEHLSNAIDDMKAANDLIGGTQ